MSLSEGQAFISDSILTVAFIIAERASFRVMGEAITELNERGVYDKSHSILS